MPNGDGIGIKNLEQALARYIEIGIETGVATGGSNTTLEDTTKGWEVNRWAPGDIHIVKDGIEYVRTITANTATVITFAALPVGVSAAAGDSYSVRSITVPQDVTDRWARELGQIDIARTLGAALAHANPLIARITDGAAFIDPRDVSDRAVRLLGVIYGSQGQQLVQRAATFDLIAQLRHAGAEIDPRAIRALIASDIVTVQSLTQWGGVALTGRDISLDLANLDLALTALRDAICAAGASAKTLNDLYTQLAATLARNIAQIGGTAQTGADWTPLLQNLDVALSTLATETELAKKVSKATTPTKYALTITNADTEYSQALPANTKQFSVHLRDMSEFRLAYETGKVATPTDPYETVPAGSEKYVENIEPSSLTLYIAAPTGTKVAEIEAWV